MTANEINEIVSNYAEIAENKFPRFLQENVQCFKIVRSMLTEDYEALPSGGKRLRLFTSYLSELIETAYVENGIKNYMKCILTVLYDDRVKSFLSQKMAEKGASFDRIMDKLYYEVTYWQGFEGVENGKLNQLISVVEKYSF